MTDLSLDHTETPETAPADARARDARRRRKDAGFTLTELMVTVLIIGLLSTAAVLTVFSLLDGARETRAKADVRTISTALEFFRGTFGRYPTTDQGLDALVSAPTGLNTAARYPAEGFMPRVPLDPWGASYIYEAPGNDGRPYDLYSLGADGQPGGEGLDADISVWSL